MSLQAEDTGASKAEATDELLKSDKGENEELDAFEARAAYIDAGAGSTRVLAVSAWVVDLERQQEGYTADRFHTIASMLCGSFFVIAFSAIYVLIFCSIQLGDDVEERIGFGDVVFETLIGLGNIAIGVAVATAVFLGFLYIVDVWNWSQAGACIGLIGKVLVCTGMIAVFISSLIGTALFPALPFMTFWVSLLGLLVSMKTFVFPTVQKVFFLRSLQITLFLCSCAMIVLYSIAVFGNEQFFGAEVQVVYFALLDCDPVFFNGEFRDFQQFLDDELLLAQFLNSTTDFPDCDEAFLVWAAPGFFFLVALLLAGVMFFLYRAEKQRIELGKAVGIEPLAQVFLASMLLSLLGLWISASIASATAAVGDAILSVSFMTLILMMATAIAVFGVKYLDSQIKKTAIGKKAYEFFSSNWGKGLLVVTSTPVIFLFLATDYIKQKVRTKTFLGKKIVDEEEKKMKFTKTVSLSIKGASHWEWGSVITVALVWGMIFFMLSVGVSRLTIVFLSFLRDSMADLNLGQATGVLVGVGLFLFLLPPVPGVPVYITAGVVLPTIAEDQIGLVGAIAYGTFIGVCLKLTALVMQQKLIGEGCGSKSVAVRSAVGVNSVELRAMRRVLAEGTFSWKKVAILCGGPDWPTSVLTGIMKLSLFKMMLGTTPIVFLIAPCVISGAMLVKASEDPEDEFFNSINTVAIFLTVVVQAASMLFAAQVLATAAVKYKDELENDELDQEVLALENRTRAKKLNYKAVTAWVNLTTTWRVLHIVNLCLMIIACYAFQLLGSTLFISFDITDNIGADLGGNFLHIVTREGWVAVAIFGIASLYYFVFKFIHQRKVASPEEYEKAGVNPEDQADETMKKVAVEAKNPLAVAPVAAVLAPL